MTIDRAIAFKVPLQPEESVVQLQSSGLDSRDPTLLYQLK